MNKEQTKEQMKKVELLLSLTNRAISERNSEEILGPQRDRLSAELGLLKGKLRGKKVPKTKKV